MTALAPIQPKAQSARTYRIARRRFGHLYRRGRIWWVRFQVNGEMHYESARSAQRAGAVALLNRRETEIAAGTYAKPVRVPLAPTPLRAVRLARGLTQEQLGRISGTSEQVVSRWERKGVPSVWVRLGRIADALGCSADEVLGRTTVERPTDAISARERAFLDAARDHVLALYGDDVVARSGGWLRIAEIGWLGFLEARRDQDLPRPDNDAPYVEEAAAQHRVACYRAAQRGQRMPRYVPPPPRGEPEPGFTLIDGRIWPENWYSSWESPLQAAHRLNLPAPSPAEVQILLAVAKSKALPAPDEQGKVVSAAEAAQRLGIHRLKMVHWIQLGLVKGARKMGNWWSVPVATVDALAAAGRPRLTEGAKP